MKKIIIFLIFILFNFIYSYSDANLSLGFGYDFAFNIFSDNENSFNSFRASPSITISGYRFSENSNIGYLANSIIWFFPDSLTLFRNGDEENRSFDSTLHVSTIFGIAFRNNLSEKWVQINGGGISVFYGHNKFNEYISLYNKTIAFTASNLDLGIGGDSRIIYFITDKIGINFGVAYSFEFFRLLSLLASDHNLDSSGMVKDFLQFRIRPYLSFCFSIN